MTLPIHERQARWAQYSADRRRKTLPDREDWERQWWERSVEGTPAALIIEQSANLFFTPVFPKRDPSHLDNASAAN
jgi:hypothetical protein